MIMDRTEDDQSKKEIMKIINIKTNEFKTLGKFDEDDKNTYHIIKEIEEETKQKYLGGVNETKNGNKQ